MPVPDHEPPASDTWDFDPAAPPPADRGPGTPPFGAVPLPPAEPFADAETRQMTAPPAMPPFPSGGGLPGAPYAAAPADPPAFDPGFDFGAVDFDAPPPPPPAPPAETGAFDFDDFAFDQPPPPPAGTPAPAAGLEFDPAADPPAADEAIREFLEADPAEPESADGSGAFAPPVLGPGTPDDLRLKPPSAAERTRELAQRLRRHVDRRVIAGTIAVAILGAGAALEFTTPYGFWFRKPLLGYDGPGEGTPLARNLAAARTEIRRGNFASYQKAIAAAERGLAESPEDVHARALFARAAFALQRAFGTGAPLPQAQSHLAAIIATSRDEPEVRKARAAAALHEGKADRVAEVLGPLPESGDVEALALLALAHLASDTPAAAQPVLERALAAAPGSASLLHLQGVALLAADDVPAATARFTEAFAADKQHAASAVELARLAFAAGATEDALAHADAALAPGAVAGIGGRVLATAHAIRGSALARLRKPDDAVAAFDKALEASPGLLDARVRYARFLLDRNQAEKAGQILESERARAEKDREVAELLVRAWTETGKMLQADKLVAGLRKAQPEDARLFYLQGLVEMSNRKYEEAETSFREAIARDEADVDAQVALARTLLALDRTGPALEAIDAAVKSAPDRAAAHAAAGEIHLAAGSLPAALEAFDAALRIDGEFVAAHEGKARTLEAQGDLPAAASAWETLLAVNDALPEHHLRYGTALWKQKDYARSIAALEAGLKVAPENAALLARLGAAQFDAGQVDAAIATIEKALALDETNAESFLYLARFKLAGGDTSAAGQAIRRAIALDGSNAAYPYQLGLIYEEANNPVEALEAFQAAVKIDPDHADALERQGNILITLNAGARAVKAFEAALARDPSRTRLLLSIADTHLQSNRWDAAIKTLGRARGQAELQGVSFRMGTAYEQKGQHAEAISWFQKAAREDPNDARPWRQLGYAYKARNRLGDAVAAFRRYLEKAPEADDRAEIEDDIATLRR